tara:strand:+ start:375 stop:1823 length:1449 start_codon:yes stop_codon:yes gene_type:complete
MLSSNRRLTMKKLLLILLCLPMIGFGQACQYGSSIDASEICDFYKGNNFETYKNADIALNKILDVTGMSKRFVLKECNDISNCIATSYKGIRYILYDRNFMDAIATMTNSWSNLSILAHEIGHHVNGHSLDLIVYASEAAEAPTLSESRQMEIEADEYSGFVMYKLGASLSQAQEAIRLVSTNDDDSYSTHPSKDKRLAAIERGYNNAKSKGSKKENTNNNKNSTSSSTLTAKDYFNLALEASTRPKDLASGGTWRWDYDAVIYNTTKCIELDPTYTEAYYKRGRCYEFGISTGDSNIALFLMDYAKAIELDNHYQANIQTGNYYRYQANYKEAILHFTQAIKKEPFNAEAYSGRADALRSLAAYNDYYNIEYQEDFSKLAIQDYIKCISLEPNNPRHYHDRATTSYQPTQRNIRDCDMAISLYKALGNEWSMKAANTVLYHRAMLKKHFGLPFCADLRSSCEAPNHLLKEEACDDYEKWCE